MRIKQVLVLLLVLSGCTLASPIKENNQDSENPGQDDNVFVGMYLTTTDETLGDIKIFDRSDKTQTYFIVDEQKENDQTYSFSETSGKFINSHVGYHVKDEGRTITFVADVPVVSTKEEIISAHQIYKDKDGKYNTQPVANYFSSNLSSLTFNSTKTNTINDEEVTDEFDIVINFIPFDPLVQAKVIIMDSNYTTLSSMIIDDLENIEITSQNEMVLIEETRINDENIEYKTVIIYTYQQVKDENNMQHIVIKEGDSIFGDVQVITITATP